VTQSLPHQVSNAKATNLSLLHHIVRHAELGALLLDERPPFCEPVLIAITLKQVFTQVFVLMEVVENFLPKCNPLLLGSTSWILSNFHQSLSKHHVLKVRVCSSSFGLSLDPGSEFVRKQWLVVDRDQD
jgi:hypothetical protein